jgi:hypothetical protein
VEASPHTPAMLSHSYQKLVKSVDRLHGWFLPRAGRPDLIRVQKLLGVCNLFIYPVEKPLLKAIDDHHAVTELTERLEHR